MGNVGDLPWRAALCAQGDLLPDADAVVERDAVAKRDPKPEPALD